MGLNDIEIERKTAMPYEEQFWDQIDDIFGLTEEKLHEDLPYFVVDPSNQAKVEALLGGRRKEAIGQESSKTIQAGL